MDLQFIASIKFKINKNFKNKIRYCFQKINILKDGQKEQASIMINKNSVNLDYFSILFGFEFAYFTKMNESDEFC